MGSDRCRIGMAKERRAGRRWIGSSAGRSRARGRPRRVLYMGLRLLGTDRPGRFVVLLRSLGSLWASYGAQGRDFTTKSGARQETSLPGSSARCETKQKSRPFSV
jgi:hypothetical protein